MTAKTYSLKCESIKLGSFSGERICCFNAYDGEKIVKACPPAPKGYVDEKSKTIQVMATSTQGDKTRIRFPIGGSGGFDHFTVPSSGLINLVEDTLV